MVQRERATEPIPAEVTEKLADRLHHLSMAEAERVLERAIALQSEAEMATPNTIDTEMLGRIAAELQVDPAICGRRWPRSCCGSMPRSPVGSTG